MATKVPQGWSFNPAPPPLTSTVVQMPNGWTRVLPPDEEDEDGRTDSLFDLGQQREQPRTLENLTRPSFDLTQPPPPRQEVERRLRLQQELTEQLRKGLPKYQGFGAALMSGLNDLGMLVSSGFEAVGEATGFEALESAGEFGREKYTRINREREADLGERGKFSEISSVGDAFGWARQTAGNLIPVMVPAALGSVAGAAVGGGVGVLGTVGAVAGAFAPSALLGVGEVQSAMKEKDPESEADAWVFVGGTAIGALDSVLPGKIGSQLIRVFGREAAEEIAMRALLRPAAATALSRIPREAGKDAMIEGITESVQEAIGEVTASLSAEQKINWEALPEQMLEAGAAGALMGGGVGAATGAAESSRARSMEQEAALAERYAAGAEALRLTSPGLTDTDRASPFSDSAILAGKTRIAELLGENPFTETPATTGLEALPEAAPVSPLAEEGFVPRARPTPAPAAAEPTAGGIDEFMAQVRGAESSGDDSARNPRSSAAGRYQFTDSTWLSYYKRRYGSDLSDAQILAKKGDGAVQDRLMRDLTQDNAAALESAGIPQTAGNLYLAHFAGPEGARKLHQADPGASVESVLGAAVVNANPFLEGMNAAEVIAWADGKMGGTGVAIPGATERIGPDQTSALPTDDELRTAARGTTEDAAGMLRSVLGEDVLEPKAGERVEVTQNGETVAGTVEDVWEQDGRQGVRIRQDDGTIFDEALEDAAEFGARITRPVGRGSTPGAMPTVTAPQGTSPVATRATAPEGAARLPAIGGEPTVQPDFLGGPDITATDIDARQMAETVARDIEIEADDAPNIDSLTEAVEYVLNPSNTEGDREYSAQQLGRELGRTLTEAEAVSYARALARRLNIATPAADTQAVEEIARTEEALPISDATIQTRNPARLEPTSTGKGIAVIGASGAEIAAINAAVPKARGVPRKSDGALVYSKKHEAAIRAALGEAAALGEIAGEFVETSRIIDQANAELPAGFKLRQTSSGLMLQDADNINVGGPFAPPGSSPEVLRRAVATARERAVERAGGAPAAEPVTQAEAMRARTEAEGNPLDAIPSTDEGELALIEAQDAIAAVVNETAKKSGAVLVPDFGDKVIADIAQGVLDGKDAEQMARAALKRGDITTEESTPELRETRPMDASTIVPAPAKQINSADYAGGFITPAEAASRLAEWKAEAKRIGQTKRDGQIILSLFDASGVFSQPYKDMGYEVYNLDIKNDHDLLRHMPDALALIADYQQGGARIVGVLAQPPCTTFAASGARWWKERHNRDWTNMVEEMWGDWASKQFNTPLEYNQALVAATEAYIAAANPEFFVIENPAGRIEEMTGLPKPLLVMQPHHFGDPYTKRTHLYGKFNPQLRTANVEPTEGSRSWNLRSTDEKEQGLRSLTSEPFAYAFALDNAPGVTAAERTGEGAPAAAISGASAAAPTVVEGGAQTRAEPTANRLVTDERAAELRKRLREKLNPNRLNAGIDPELLALGAELTVYHVEKGARRFAAAARAIAADLDLPLEAVRKYLRGWYNGARDFMEDSGESVAGMDDAAEVGRAMRTFAEWSALPTTAENAITPVEETTNAGPAPANRAAEPDRDGDEGVRPGDAQGAEEGAGGAAGGPAVESRDGGDDVLGAGIPSEDRDQPGEQRPEPAADDLRNVPGEEPSGGSRAGAGRRVRRERGGIGRNYAAPAGSLKRQGSWRETASRNLDVVELVNRLDAASTGNKRAVATPEEQALLASFTGWGAGEIRNNLFKNIDRLPSGERVIRVESWETGEWVALKKRAKELLRGEDLETALQSTQYAHYTSEAVIRSIWQGVERLGFGGGRILEPGMGNALFPVAAPEGIMRDSHYTGIELDKFTAKVAAYLLPHENALNADFIKHNLPDGFFDLAIGNPPFSDTKVLADPRYKKQRFMLHDYFFAKSIDKVRPGGLLVFVTSKGTMDKLDQKARKYIADRADLIGAIRLPQTAFKENAGTEVVTDVLFLQRRAPGQEPGGAAWLGVKNVTATSARGEKSKVMVNEYFADNPKMVLGKHSTAGSMYRADEYTVTPLEGNIETHFAKAIARLPEGVYFDAPKEAKEAAQAKTFERDFTPAHKKEGGLYLKDGKVYRVESGSGVPIEGTGERVSAADLAWLKGYTELRDTLKQAQKDQLQDGDWEKSLAALVKQYDAFTKKHGPIKSFTTSERKTVDEEGNESIVVHRRYKWQRLLDLDVEGVLVEALEKITDEGEIVRGAFLLGRTLNKPTRRVIENAQDALAVTLDDIGRLDLAYAANLLGRTREELIEALGDGIYEAPDGVWQTSDEYLSGDVVAKLEEARTAADADPRFERNVQALFAVQPKPLSHADITVKLGAGWVPVDVVREFTQEILGFETAISYDPNKASWTVEGAGARFRRGNANEYGTDKRSPLELLDAVLNNRTIKVFFPKDSDGKTTLDPVSTEAAVNAARKIGDKFKSWVWTDAKRAERLSSIYNRGFNNIAPRSFNGDHLTFPGLSSRYTLRPHQKRVVWRQIQTGNTYLGHAVGAGKTLEMIVGGMEQRRLGLIKKPMYAVPNHMLKQFSYEFLEAYPAANIMVADEKAFHTGNRKRFMAQVALNDPDAIIITHSSFKKIDTGPEARALVMADMMAELEEALEEAKKDSANRHTRSRVEGQIEKLKQRFEGKTDASAKDKALTFEEMGVDFLYIDEGHEFRKLDFATNRSAKGITPEGSQKAMDLFIKVRWLDAQNPGRSLVMGSGTPITNTMAELYTVMRYMDLAGLERDGLAHFDAWANQFGEMSAALEKNAVGNYEMVERFNKFVNVADLMRRVRTFMDVLTSDQLGDLVQRPAIKGRAPANVVSPPVEALQEYMAGPLNERLVRSKNWKPSPSEPNNPDPIIAINGDALLSSIDMRFVRPGLKNDPESKLNVMIDRIIEVAKRTASIEYVDPATGKKDMRKGGAQIIFSPVGFGEQVAKNRGFSAREWIDGRLIEAGFKKSEIGWMSDANTHAKKEQLQKDVREGRVRFLFGSPKNMGTGLNVQKRLFALHYLSPPWYPSDVEQPHGRIERQGNLNPEIEIYWYATQDTYEASAWGMVTNKARFIQQALSGDDSVRVIDDISAVSQYEMAAALAAGDDRVIRMAGLGSEIEKFQRLRAAHAENQRSLARDQRWLQKSIPETEKEVARLKEAVAARGSGLAAFSLDVGGTTYDKPGEGGKALIEAIDTAVNSSVAVPRREVAKFHGKHPVILAPAERIGDAWEVFLQVGPVEFEFIAPRDSTADMDPVGIGRRLENTFANITGDLRTAEGKLDTDRQQLTAIEKRIGTPFEDEAKLAEAIAERATIEAQLAAEGAVKEAAVKAKKAGEPTPTPRASLAPRARAGSWGNALLGRDAEIRAALQAQLEAYGIADRITLEAARRLTLAHPEAQGESGDGIIAIALDKARDPEATLAHETIHAMRDLGLFTPAEWRSLVNAAWANDKLRARMEREYAHLTVEDRKEEAAAEHFAAYYRDINPNGDGLWTRALRRILRFVAAVGAAVDKVLGRPASPELLARLVQAKIVSGEIGARLTGSGDYARFDVAPQRPVFGRKRTQAGDRVLYHGGTLDADVTPNTPLFLAEDRAFAEGYARDRGQGSGRVTAFTFTPKRTATADDIASAAKAAGVSQADIEQTIPGALVDPAQTGDDAIRTVAELRRRGFDSAEFMDFAIDDERSEQRAYAVFDAAALSSPRFAGDTRFPIGGMTREQALADLDRRFPDDPLYGVSSPAGGARVGSLAGAKRETLRQLLLSDRRLYDQHYEAVMGWNDRMGEKTFGPVRVGRGLPEELTARGFRTGTGESYDFRTDTVTRSQLGAFADPAMEERYQDATRGIGDGPGLLAKAGEWWTDLKNGFTRHWRELPNEARFADVGQQFRKLEAAPDAAMQEAVHYLRDLVGGLGREEYDLFARKVILDDLSWEAGQKHELPFGFTPSTLRQERARIDVLVDENPKLVEAIRKRKAHNKAVANAMVKAGVLTREQIKNPAYFRHMVLDYARHEMRMARGQKSVKSPYWAKRMGSALDINANLLEAELDWLLKAQIDITTANTIEWIKNSEHNIRDRLRGEARDRNREALNEMIAADPSMGKVEGQFRSMIARGLKIVKDEIDSGNTGPIPPHLEAAARDLVNGMRDGEQPFALLAWVLDNDKPGAMGAGMVLKYSGLRKAWMRKELGDHYIDPDDIAGLVKRLKPEGYKAWQPTEGRHLFTAKTISEGALDMFIGKLADSAYPGVDKDELHRALSAIRPQLVVGNDRYTMVLPNEVADTLTEFGDTRTEGMVARTFSGIQSAWKRWILINPRRFLKYNINNLSGDLDAIIAGNPGTLRHLRQAWRELRNAANNKPSMRYQEAIERGVFTSGLSVQEIPDINRLSALRHLTEDRGLANKLTIGVVANVWRALQDSTQFRENLFRMAAYLDYIGKIERGLPMLEIGYGASVPRLVDAVADPRDRAALLARDLVGDYGAISVAGGWLRKFLIPFWSWTEINTRRYWRLTNNAFSQSKAKGVAVGGFLGAGVAVRTGAYLAIRMGMIYGLLWMWNNLLFGDEEDDLGDLQQRQLHLILGRDQDGEVITLRTQGALSDVLSMFGFTDAMAGLRRYEAGQGTLGQAAQDMLKAPVNRLATGTTPLFSVPLEQALGQELWPDIFNAREIKDRWRHVFSTFSLEHEYDQVADNPTRGYARSWEESVIYRRDPGEMAFDTAKGIAYDWLENVKGQEGGGATTPRSEALRDYRMGLRYNDLEAADEALIRYAEFGGTEQGLKTSIARQHPLGPIAKKDRAEFLDSLTDEQLEIFADAEEWYKRIFLGIEPEDEAAQ